MVVGPEYPLMAATLAEPVVLAAAKETLYPDLNTNSDQYVVTETQFATPTLERSSSPLVLPESAPFQRLSMRSDSKQPHTNFQRELFDQPSERLPRLRTVTYCRCSAPTIRG